ncbi:HVO_A0114 family putative DNA-binding protein [Serratia rhizosphaerae]
MKTVTIRVEKMNDFKADVMSAFRAAADGAKGTEEDVISFPDWQLLHKTLSPNRMAILMAMTGSGEMTIREIAALVGRDVKGVHTDVTALLASDMLERGERGTVFPYDAIHFDFTIGKAA